MFINKSTNFIFICTSKSLDHCTIFDCNKRWHCFNLVAHCNFFSFINVDLKCVVYTLWLGLRLGPATPSVKNMNVNYNNLKLTMILASNIMCSSQNGESQYTGEPESETRSIYSHSLQPGTILATNTNTIDSHWHRPLFLRSGAFRRAVSNF